MPRGMKEFMKLFLKHKISSKAGTVKGTYHLPNSPILELKRWFLELWGQWEKICTCDNIGLH